MRRDLKQFVYLVVGRPAVEVIDVAASLNIGRGGVDIHFDFISGTFAFFENVNDAMVFRLRDSCHYVRTLGDPLFSGDEAIFELDGDWSDISDLLTTIGISDKTTTLECISVSMVGDRDHQRLVAALNDPANGCWAEIIS